MSGLPDIETRADVEGLVRAFYERAMADPIIGFIFTDVAALDLDAHVPVIADFWETLLLGASSYGGGAFAPHAALDRRVKLRYGHFARWVALWTLTVSERFEGDRAEAAKAHAVRIATAFHRRLEGLPVQDEPAADGAALRIVRVEPGGATR